ncbi:MAG: agmatine deiminase family protein [Balneolales bacterium]
MNTSPKSLGYSMPPEWHRHSGTLLSWPVNRETWPGDRLDKVEKVYINIIRALYKYETIHLLVHDESVRNRVFKMLYSAGIPDDSINFHLHPSNDVWARDFGPIYIINDSGNAAITNWDYNAWGGKYPPFESDNKVPAYLAKKFNQKVFKPDLVLEGGSIETNGAGVILTTESVLLNPNRNSRYSKGDIEDYLKEYLGHEHIVWLKDGLKGDDTDGHIDDLVRFVSENTIVAALCDDPKDVNYETLLHNYEILKSVNNPLGEKFEIITMPMPQTKIDGTTVDGSEYVPASYANFYIANGVILLPLYDDRYDEQVLNLFRQLFPDREIVGINCADLVWGQGGIHCITQQIYN